MAIQQHPIPQNVTSFQFRLVGDMTLKQFFQLAGGIIVSLIIYALPLPGFLKWPLVAIPAALGAGMAFLPVQGRPMDQWLMAFFRSIYQPTIFTWTRSVEPIAAKPTQPIAVPKPTPPQPIGGKVEVIPQPPMRPVSPINLETASVSFQPTSAATSSVPVIMPAKPTLSPREIIQPEAETMRKTGAVTVPIAPIKIQPQAKPIAAEAQPGPRTPATPQIPTQTTGPTAPSGPTSTPVFSSNLPIPSTPQTPNTVVGMTLTPEGKILEGAIVEVRLKNTTVRATKSNKLGQFMFLKPLDDGIYQLTAEKDGFTFPTFSLTVAGKVILPIKLQATAAVPLTAPIATAPYRPMTPPIPHPQQPGAMPA